MKRIVKWTGGKERELEYILPRLPKFNRYIEPFVGGGSVFLAVDADKYIINDLSEDLYRTYKYIKEQDRSFLGGLGLINRSWKKISELADSNVGRMMYDIYTNSDKGEVFEYEMETLCRMLEEQSIMHLGSIFIGNFPKHMRRKFGKYKELGVTEENEVYEMINTVLKGTYYTTLREIYNTENDCRSEFGISMFIFLRNYCYSGMFRYDRYGNFNVPYGGESYNNKTMGEQIEFFSSEALVERMGKTEIFNEDFETFLREVEPTEEDFIFLDPPYDSTFSTYDGNTFDREDQKRLASYLINECRAKWMLVIKETDFIRGLYEGADGVNIESFGKKYSVNFKNRNERDVTHLIIRNY